jgi:hypothetical protein
MFSALTLVSLGLLTTGGIEIEMLGDEPTTRATRVIDPATADVADIDAAVKEYAVSPVKGSGETAVIDAAALGVEIPDDAVTNNVVHSSDRGADSPSSANLEEPLAQPMPEPPPASLADEAQPEAQEEFDLEGLKLDKPFVVLGEAERPSWVEQPPQLKGDGVHFISVASDPWKTDFEAGQSLDKKLRAAVNDYINDQIGRPDAAQRIRLSPETVADLVAARYKEDLQFSDTAIGAMKQVHAQLQFTPEFRAEIAERWKEHVVNARLLRTGVGVVGVFMLLVMAFGVLKRLGGR